MPSLSGTLVSYPAPFHSLHAADQYGSCSIGCYRSHNLNHVPGGSTDKARNSPPSSPDALSALARVSVDTHHDISNSNPSVNFTKLDKCKELDLLFTKYPKLQAELQAIYRRATGPPAGHQRETVFKRERGPSRALWNRETAFNDTLYTLRRKQKLNTGLSEALREFCSLVLMQQKDHLESTFDRVTPNHLNP